MNPQIDQLRYSIHAVHQMRRRRIGTHEVEAVLKNGMRIEEYPDDSPLPSMLLYASVEERPLHVVLAYDVKMKAGIVVTVYEPDPDRWNDTLTERLR